jgi:hypothetical protein
LRQGSSLYTSFQDARVSARRSFSLQEPWLDDNGDGIPNTFDDGREAARRGFGFTGTFDVEEWPPFIREATASAVSPAGVVTISAEVLVNEKAGDKVQEVWAVIYEPDYEAPQGGVEMVALPSAPVPLIASGNDRWQISYPGFTKSGAYRVVVYARNNRNLYAQPALLEVAGPGSGDQRIFLPSITR